MAGGPSHEGKAILADSEKPLACGASAAFSACIIEAVRAIPSKRFLVVLDGLDEAGAEERGAGGEVAQLLRHTVLRDEPGRNLPENLTLVLLSRRPTILDALKMPHHLSPAEWIDLGARHPERDAEHCREDIKAFLVGEHGVGKEVANAIIARDGCHFQYAALIAPDASRLESAADVETQLPRDIDERYDQMLRSVLGQHNHAVVRAILEVVVAASDTPQELPRAECVAVVRLLRGLPRTVNASPVSGVIDALLHCTLLEERQEGLQLLHASFRMHLRKDNGVVPIDVRLGHRALAGYAFLAAEAATGRGGDESSDESTSEGSGTVPGDGAAAWAKVVTWL